MYRPHNFYVIHIDRGADPELRKVRPPSLPPCLLSPSSAHSHIFFFSLPPSLPPSLPQQITKIIEATPFSTLLADEETQAHIPPSSSPSSSSFFLPKNVWENVDVVPEGESLNALWGDVTLVYLEVGRERGRDRAVMNALARIILSKSGAKYL